MRKTETTARAEKFLTDLKHDAGTHGNCSDENCLRRGQG